MNRDEMLNFLKNEARGISVMFGPNCETIVHDMTRPGTSDSGDFQRHGDGARGRLTADIFGDIGDYDESIYQNKRLHQPDGASRDGRTLKSSTFNIVGEDYHCAGHHPISRTWCAGQMLSELTVTSGTAADAHVGRQKPARGAAARVHQRSRQNEPEAMKKTESHAHHPPLWPSAAPLIKSPWRFRRRAVECFAPYRRFRFTAAVLGRNRVAPTFRLGCSASLSRPQGALGFDPPLNPLRTP